MSAAENDINILFDMDGTLYDLEGQMRRDLAKLQSPDDGVDFASYPDLWELESKFPWVKARMDLIKSVPGWWRNLPKFQLGWDIYHMAVVMGGWSFGILTKGPARRTHVWSEKAECIVNEPAFQPDRPTIHMTEDKGQVYGRVLVDDYPPYIRAWLKNRLRGLVIMPAHYYNKQFTHENVIRYDGSKESADRVRTALQAARDRDSREHWKWKVPK